MLVNITKHVLKPKHRVLTDQEKQRLLKKYNIDEKQVSFLFYFWIIKSRKAIEERYLRKQSLFDLFGKSGSGLLLCVCV